MTTSGPETLPQAAARAALGVPGVVALQPALADRLALAAARALHAVTSGADGARGAPGVRCAVAPDGSWHVEVRCILDARYRALDVARLVRAAVRAAATTYPTPYGTAPPSTVRVLVSVTRSVEPPSA